MDSEEWWWIYDDRLGDSDGAGGCDWRFGWPSSLDEGLGPLGRGELVTLLDTDGHGVTDGGGEVGSKRPSLGMLRQD